MAHNVKNWVLGPGLPVVILLHWKALDYYLRPWFFTTGGCLLFAAETGLQVFGIRR